MDKRARMLENTATNPFIDPQSWSQTLDDYRQRFLEFLDQEAQALPEFAIPPSGSSL